MDGLSQILGGGSATSGTSRSANSALSTDDFFKIMITEMSNQDPLEPLDNQQFLNQLTQMQTLQATTKLSEGIEALLLGQQISSAGALIGREVAGMSAEGVELGGVVDRVIIQDQQVLLGIGSGLVPLSRVNEVHAAATVAQ
ncbi:MAG: flagellar hook assembly protein FlgD [Planctomycetota bacterium]